MPIWAPTLAKFGIGGRFSRCRMVGYLLSRESIGRERKNRPGGIRVVLEIHLEIAQSVPNPAKNHICVRQAARARRLSLSAGVSPSQ